MSPGLSLTAREPGARCLKAGEDGSLSSSQEGKFTLPLPFFVLFGPSTVRGDAHLCWMCPLLTQFTSSNANVFQKHPPQIHPEILFYPLSRHPLVQSG